MKPPMTPFNPLAMLLVASVSLGLSYGPRASASDAPSPAATGSGGAAFAARVALDRDLVVARSAAGHHFVNGTVYGALTDADLRPVDVRRGVTSDVRLPAALQAIRLREPVREVKSVLSVSAALRVWMDPRRPQRLAIGGVWQPDAARPPAAWAAPTKTWGGVALPAGAPRPRTVSTTVELPRTVVVPAPIRTSSGDR